MPENNETLKIIKFYASKSNTPVIDFDKFLTFVKKYAEKYKSKKKELAVLEKDTDIVITSDLLSLSEEGRCELEYDGKNIVRILYPGYFREKIERAWQEYENNSALPFPSEESLQIKIPEKLLIMVDVKNDFVQWLGNDNIEESKIFRLDFPHGINSVVITPHLFKEKLLEYSMYKIRAYLREGRNAYYIQNKLAGIFKEKEITLKELIEQTLERPMHVINTVRSPTDFYFRYWTTLSNLIISDYKKKVDMLAEEHSFCQAAYLAGFYCVYFKGFLQKDRESHLAIKQVEKAIRKPPYAFTLNDIYTIKDDKGTPITKKCAREKIHSFLEKNTRKEENGKFPSILRVNTVDGKQYFIYKDNVLPLSLRRVNELGSKLRNQYVELWEQELKQFRKTQIMIDDNSFAQELENKTKEEDPLLYSLLRYDLLFVLSHESETNRRIKAEINRWFDSKKKELLPLPSILGLSREELLDDARRRLPIWQIMPVVGSLVGFFKKISRKFKSFSNEAKVAAKESKRMVSKSIKGKTAGVTSVKKEKASTVTTKRVSAETTSKREPTAKEQREAYRKKILQLKEELIGKDAKIEDSMNELIDKWNPILEEKARKNLVEDVNALVRDFLRSLRRGFAVSPPDLARVRNLAERLAENKAFDRIAKKDYLKKYIELYMVKVLGDRVKK